MAHQNNDYVGELANKSEKEKAFYFGQHQKRKYSYELKVNASRDLSNMLLIGCFPRGKYEVVETTEEDDVNRSSTLIWDNELVSPSDDVKFRKFKKTGEYVYVSKKLSIRGNGFGNHDVAFFRVGDYLSESEIARVVDVCSEFKHCLPIFLSICCSHKLAEKFLEIELQKEEKNKQTEQSAEVTNAIALSSSLMKDIMKTLLKNFSQFTIDDFERCAWLTWTVGLKSHDKFYPKQMAKKRSRWRLKLMQQYMKEHPDVDINEEEVLEEIKLLQSFMIMLITQQSKDINSSKWMFNRISTNFTTVRSYLEPLKEMSYANLLEVYMEIIRSKALYTQRAATLLNSMVIIECLYGGKVPRTSKQMRAFKQMARKKTVITLSVLGKYLDSVGMDTHVRKIIRACATGTLSDGDVLRATMGIEADPGAYFNEISAEIGQAFADRKKRGAWAKWRPILMEVANENVEYNRALNKWLGVNWKSS